MIPITSSPSFFEMTSMLSVRMAHRILPSASLTSSIFLNPVRSARQRVLIIRKTSSICLSPGVAITSLSVTNSTIFSVSLYLVAVPFLPVLCFRTYYTGNLAVSFTVTPTITSPPSSLYTRQSSISCISIHCFLVHCVKYSSTECHNPAPHIPVNIPGLNILK